MAFITISFIIFRGFRYLFSNAGFQAQKNDDARPGPVLCYLNSVDPYLRFQSVQFVDDFPHHIDSVFELR